jgi:hypothetical protein
MKINQIIYETTTAGAVAAISKPLGEVQKRPEVKGITPVGQLSKKKNGPYANSLNEGAMKQLSSDLKGGPDGLSDQEFQKKYNKSLDCFNALLLFFILKIFIILLNLCLL